MKDIVFIKKNKYKIKTVKWNKNMTFYFIRKLRMNNIVIRYESSVDKF